MEAQSMKLSEFVLTHTKEGSSLLDFEYFADVSVTSRSGWFGKKTERRKIHRHYGSYWHFVDDGNYTPAGQAEALERAYKAKESLDGIKA
jgi:hypothetical protein